MKISVDKRITFVYIISIDIETTQTKGHEITTIIDTKVDAENGVAVELFENNAGKNGVRVYDVDAGYDCTYSCVIFPSLEMATDNFKNM